MLWTHAELMQPLALGAYLWTPNTHFALWSAVVPDPSQAAF